MSRNYEEALASFNKYRLKFSQRPNGQMTVERKGVVVDFWPSSGTWRARTGGRSKGLKNLLKFIFNPEQFEFDAPSTNKSKVANDRVIESKRLLDEKGIPYRALTPYHLRIQYNGGFVDFWPSSEKWSVNGAKSTQGVIELFQFLENKRLKVGEYV